MLIEDEVMTLFNGLITSVKINQKHPSLEKDLCVIAGEFHGEEAFHYMHFSISVDNGASS
jgi:hypothetical protein